MSKPKQIYISTEEYEEYLKNLDKCSDNDEIIFYAETGDLKLVPGEFIPVLEYKAENKQLTGRYTTGIVRVRHVAKEVILGYGISITPISTE